MIPQGTLLSEVKYRVMGKYINMMGASKGDQITYNTLLKVI